jgi:hypothetical protein
MNTKDGGPAFPGQQQETQNGEWNQSFSPGMTLRDWFAGQVLASALNAGYSEHPALTAKTAYELADAMFVAREKPLRGEGSEDWQIAGRHANLEGER